MMIKRVMIVFIITLMASVASAIDLPATGTVEVCFTPGEDCTGEIVQEINGARREILLQAYEFTSTPIAKAMAAAARRGVRVIAILDKSQRTSKYSGATYLLHAGVPVYIDERPSIAHNKIIIVDRADVITGSFNYTRAAQEWNAENLLILRGNESLVEQYLRNFASRQSVSVQY
jgi:phosphatidylserine/phosphatidylglycerophosphate/cardiolipin synthase-like enzyme